MKKIINQPADVVPEMLSGLVHLHPDLLRQVPNATAVMQAQKPQKPQVALVSGGGSGHEPAHAGYVGAGMLQAAVLGKVFTSPTPDQILTTIMAVDQGKGVFLIIKNYSGDVMNFQMAQDMARAEGISVDSVVVGDDIAVENSTYTQGRRGVAGVVFVHKLLGAAAASGASLSEIKTLATQILPHIKTIGVALNAATVPEVGKPGFELAPDEMEYGVGIHSEPGYRREHLKPAKQIAAELLEKITAEMPLTKNNKYALLVNGLGATPLMEQYILGNDAQNWLKIHGITPAFVRVGNYMTSLDMAGISLTLFELTDEKWLRSLEFPVATLAWNNEGDE